MFITMIHMRILDIVKMCSIVLLTAVVLQTGCLGDNKQVIHGVLHGQVIWSGTIYIDGDVTLSNDSSLTILPGTRILFMSSKQVSDRWSEHPNFPGSELIVAGRLHAIGTPDNPIYFEAADQSANAGVWGAVNIEASQEAVFEYCVFRQANSAIHSRDSQVYIEESLFENNLIGIRFHDSEILIEHNLLRNNGTAIRFHYGSPVICENQFANNEINIFVTSYPRDYHIENNTFGDAGNYQIVLGESVPNDFKVSRNFWPLEDAQELSETFFDGRRSSYLGRVIFEPPRTMPSEQAGITWNP